MLTIVFGEGKSLLVQTQSPRKYRCLARILHRILRTAGNRPEQKSRRWSLFCKLISSNSPLTLDWERMTSPKSPNEFLWRNADLPFSIPRPHLNQPVWFLAKNSLYFRRTSLPIPFHLITTLRTF